jgi:hypothetical protein
MRFERARASATSEEDRIRLAHKMPGIYWAHATYTDDTNPVRWDIEAHILARCTDQEIGFHCGVPVEVVEAYENLFFNVRDRLQHTGYIVHKVMGESVQRGCNERAYDLLWKMYAYAYGPHMLHAISSKFVSPNYCMSPDDVSAAVQDDTVSTMKLKAALAAKTIPVNAGTQTDILHIFTKYVEIEQTTDSAGKAQSQILNHIGTMFEVLPLNIGGLDPLHGQRPIAQGPLQDYDDTAIELSFEETMAVGAGKQLENAALLRSMKFPPSPVELEAGGSTP